jgi:glutaredoxin-related protein
MLWLGALDTDTPNICPQVAELQVWSTIPYPLYLCSNEINGCELLHQIVKNDNIWKTCTTRENIYFF